MKLKHAFLALTLAAFASCKKDEAVPPAEPKSPVQTGTPVKSTEPQLSYGLEDVKGLKPTMSYDEAKRTSNFAQFLAWRVQDPKLNKIRTPWQGNLVQIMYDFDLNGYDYIYERGERSVYPLNFNVIEKKNRQVLHCLISKKCDLNISSLEKKMGPMMKPYDIYKSGATSPLLLIAKEPGTPNEESQHWIHCLIQNGAKINTIYARQDSNINEKYYWKSNKKTREFSKNDYWGTLLDMIIGRYKGDKNDPFVQQLRDYGCVTCEEAIKNPALQQMTAKPEAIKKYADLGKIEKVWEDPKFIEEWHAKYRKDLQDLKDSQ